MSESLSQNPIIEKILHDYANRCEVVFRREVQANNKVLTGELLASIRTGAVERGAGFIEAHIHYDALLRIRDMKTLNYKTVPPIGAMVQFVEKTGVDKFPIVHGYPDKRPDSYTATVYRIATSLQYHFKRSPNVKRGYRGLYNDPLRKEILPKFYYELRQDAGAFALSTFRDYFQNEN